MGQIVSLDFEWNYSDSEEETIDTHNPEIQAPTFSHEEVPPTSIESPPEPCGTPSPNPSHVPSGLLPTWGPPVHLWGPPPRSEVTKPSLRRDTVGQSTNSQQDQLQGAAGQTQLQEDNMVQSDALVKQSHKKISVRSKKKSRHQLKRKSATEENSLDKEQRASFDLAFQDQPSHGHPSCDPHDLSLHDSHDQSLLDRGSEGAVTDTAMETATGMPMRAGTDTATGARTGMAMGATTGMATRTVTGMAKWCRNWPGNSDCNRNDNGGHVQLDHRGHGRHGHGDATNMAIEAATGGAIGAATGKAMGAATDTAMEVSKNIIIPKSVATNPTSENPTAARSCTESEDDPLNSRVSGYH
jgi:hypothetical protein